jgi:hypothetical protein
LLFGPTPRAPARQAIATTVCALAAIGLLAGCGSDGQAKAVAAAQYNHATTGLNVATFDVSCPGGPVRSGDSGCRFRQARAAFRLRRKDGSAPPRRVRTSRDGRAFVDVAPGVYHVVPFARYRHGQRLGPAPAPFDVVVEADRRSPVIIDYFREQAP